MRNLFLLVAALAAASTFVGAQQMENPKVEQHDALQQLAGDWDWTSRIEAIPGVPGFEKVQQSAGSEHAELICNGLWLKTVKNSTLQGRPFQSISLLGYDKFQNSYDSFGIDSAGPGCSSSGVTYDEKTRTWTFKGNSKHGAMRSTLVFTDKDNSTQTYWMTGPDGKEMQWMEATRKRASKPAPELAVDASLKAANKNLEPLWSGIGTWTARMKMSGSDMPAGEGSADQATEKVTPICNGNWVWTDFTGAIMGQPFEGHGFTGYDADANHYVNYWIDSWNCLCRKTTGPRDAGKNTLTLDGACCDSEGKPATVHQVMASPDANTRTTSMTFKSPARTVQVEITYRKAAGKS
jgi:hypothetical protein